ncbi:MAG: tRNA (adenosine(37)-N6)-threonylcarbamoyltransferase complex ATPase subunit type 1 TsaE [Propionibacteriaceae bacterium]|nr:tRNA (adenosine(37)-N6)-threonylcarbamoyltransferase complex ATPase subunit type 1 TsaE [Propionibacteriaceae bacterium]
MTEISHVRLATAADAPEMLRVAQAAFSARRAVEPPPEALSDTLADVQRALESGWGVCAFAGNSLVGSLLIARDGESATLRRVSVLPEAAGHGVARAIVTGAVALAADAGLRRVQLLCRREFPELAAWWREHGFEVVAETEAGLILGRDLPVVLTVATADDMRRLGTTLAGLLRVGDLIIASGDLGAGKTTLTQGIGEGLGVAGPVISPTFVISRIHPSLGEGPDLVHVDAYRMGDAGELADIDLDTTLERAVTLIEWGQGLAEWLSDERLEIDIDREAGEDHRRVTLTGLGPRWAGALEHLRTWA